MEQYENFVHMDRSWLQDLGFDYVRLYSFRLACTLNIQSVWRLEKFCHIHHIFPFHRFIFLPRGLIMYVLMNKIAECQSYCQAGNPLPKWWQF